MLNRKRPPVKRTMMELNPWLTKSWSGKSIGLRLCACLALLSPAAVDAAIISGNDPSIVTSGLGHFVTGTGNITIDEGTGLSWLDLTLSTGLSYNQVTAQFAPGGQFAGYRYATTAEVETFWRNSGIPNPAFKVNESSAAIATLQSLWGVTRDLTSLGQIQSLAITSTPYPFDPTLVWFGQLINFPNETDIAVAPSGGQSRDLADPTRGSALVRSTAAVVVAPEPASLVAWLTIAATFGAYFRKDTKKARC